MNFQPLSALVRDLRALARRAPLTLSADLRAAYALMAPSVARDRSQAAALALRQLGHPDHEPRTEEERMRADMATMRLAGVMAMVDCAELALSFGPQLLVHALQPSAVRTVHTTDLHALPGEPPRLLRRPFLLESEWERGKRLFGNTACLGGYPLPDGRITLVGLLHPDGVSVVVWEPRWGEREVLRPDDAPLLLEGGTREQHFAWGQQAARVAAMLGLLLDAEGTPLRYRDESGAGAIKKPMKAVKPGQGWTVRHVQVSERDTETAARARSAHGGTTSGIEGREAQEVTVRGHIKRQRHGPGNSLSKTIYVPGYSARRWVAPEVEVRVS